MSYLYMVSESGPSPFELSVHVSVGPGHEGDVGNELLVCNVYVDLGNPSTSFLVELGLNVMCCYTKSQVSLS